MADIQAYIDQIRNAVYGEEVRGSIINAIEAINNGGSGGGGGGASTTIFSCNAVTSFQNNVTIAYSRIVNQTCRRYGGVVNINLELTNIQSHNNQEMAIVKVPSGYEPAGKVYVTPIGTNSSDTIPKYACLRTDGYIVVPWTVVTSGSMMVNFTYIINFSGGSSSDGDDEIIVEEWYEENPDDPYNTSGNTGDSGDEIIDDVEEEYTEGYD